MVTHLWYLNQTTLKNCKPKECPWQGKIKSGVTVLLTNDWFSRNIEYRQGDWYCTNVEMDKDITTIKHFPWLALPGTDSVLADATSTVILNAVTKLPTPLKNKKV